RRSETSSIAAPYPRRYCAALSSCQETAKNAIADKISSGFQFFSKAPIIYASPAPCFAVAAAAVNR
ncbi:hypothetical protein I5237_11325, partial [Neisseria gonorrhoeae]